MDRNGVLLFNIAFIPVVLFLTYKSFALFFFFFLFLSFFLSFFFAFIFFVTFTFSFIVSLPFAHFFSF